MTEEIKFLLDSTEESMLKALRFLEKQLMNIRAGKASPGMVAGVTVNYYGTPTPLSQVANINTPDGRTLSIQPWEKNMIPEIEKGILKANLGFNPMNNGDNIIINIPPLTEERRRELAKVAKSEAEDAKISIRNDRKIANSEAKELDISEDLLKIVETDIQKLTDKYIARVDEIYAIKEKEIMTV